mmetsp:Transcript_6346/g.9222  ORF Transcript_6346/g.9222 Transcript_6346/m.9222 type:complete len:117 (-) Transcript_6346:96-446(-)
MKRGSQHILVGRNLEQNTVSKRPKQCLAQNETTPCLDELRKILSKRLEAEKLSDIYVEETSNLVEEMKRKLDTAKRKYCFAIKCKREAEVQIKRAKRMVAEAELHDTNNETPITKI